MPRPMMFLAAHAPDRLLAPGGLLEIFHRFLFNIGRQNITSPRLRFFDHRHRGLIISPLMVLRVNNVSYQGSQGLKIPLIEAIEG